MHNCLMVYGLKKVNEQDSKEYVRQTTNYVILRCAQQSADYGVLICNLIGTCKVRGDEENHQESLN